MLTLTSEATQAIERILQAPGVPDGAGLRIKPVTDDNEPAVTSELQVSVEDQPREGDEVIEADRARVFVEERVCDYLADKQLDAHVVDERVSFSLAGRPAE